MTDADGQRDLSAKYDALASGYSSRYAAPELVSGFFVRVVRSWGREIPAGSSVLELGCADGFMTEALVRAGFSVTAIDLSAQMIEVAGRRLGESGLSAELSVGNIDTLESDRSWDVVLGAMWTFFAYAENAPVTLARLRRSCRAKLIVDVDPRRYTVERAEAEVRGAGFGRTAVRPVAVPQGVSLGRLGTRAFEGALRIPPIRAAILRRKLNMAVLGLP